MKIEFLQTESDIDHLIDFLYDAEFFLIRDSAAAEEIPMSREHAREVLYFDLMLSGKNYFIEKNGNSSAIQLFSCGRTSHPRFAEQMCRNPGVICTEDPQNINSFQEINNYFKKNYTLSRYNEPAKFRCRFGPDYQRLDAAYASDPFPALLCGGFISIISNGKRAEKAEDILRKTLDAYPEFQNVKIRTRTHSKTYTQRETAAGFWLDRNLYDISLLEAVAKDLACEGDRIRAVQEKRYEVIYIYQREADWNVRIHVDYEWKGFGNSPEKTRTWLVK